MKNLFKNAILNNDIAQAKDISDKNPLLLDSIYLNEILVLSIFQKVNAETVALLLELGASPSAEMIDEDSSSDSLVKNTAIGTAMLNEDSKVLELLISEGGDMKIAIKHLKSLRDIMDIQLIVINDILDKVSNNKIKSLSVWTYENSYLALNKIDGPSHGFSDTVKVIIQNAYDDIQNETLIFCTSNLAKIIKTTQDFIDEINRAVNNLEKRALAAVAKMDDDAAHSEVVEAKRTSTLDELSVPAIDNEKTTSNTIITDPIKAPIERRKSLNDFTDNLSLLKFLITTSRLPFIENFDKAKHLGNNGTRILIETMWQYYSCDSESYAIDQDCYNKLIDYLQAVDRQYALSFTRDAQYSFVNRFRPPSYEDENGLYSLAASGLLNKENIELFAANLSAFNQKNVTAALSLNPDLKTCLKNIIQGLENARNEPIEKGKSPDDFSDDFSCLKFLINASGLPFIENFNKAMHLDKNGIRILIETMWQCYSCDSESYAIDQDCYNKLIDYLQAVDAQYSLVNKSRQPSYEDENGLYALATFGLLNKDTIELFAANLSAFNVKNVTAALSLNPDLKTCLKNIIQGLENARNEPISSSFDEKLANLIENKQEISTTHKLSDEPIALSLKREDKKVAIDDAPTPPENVVSSEYLPGIAGGLNPSNPTAMQLFKPSNGPCAKLTDDSDITAEILLSSELNKKGEDGKVTTEKSAQETFMSQLPVSPKKQSEQKNQDGIDSLNINEKKEKNFLQGNLENDEINLQIRMNFLMNLLEEYPSKRNIGFWNGLGQDGSTTIKKLKKLVSNKEDFISLVTIRSVITEHRKTMNFMENSQCSGTNYVLKKINDEFSEKFSEVSNQKPPSGKR